MHLTSHLPRGCHLDAVHDRPHTILALVGSVFTVF